MRRAMIAVVLAVVLTPGCAQSGEGLYTVDAGYLSRGTVFVTDDVEGAAKDPMRELLTGGEAVGWRRLSPDEPVVVKAGRKLILLLSAMADWRWTHCSEPRVEVNDNRLTLLARLHVYPGPHIMNYVPSIWSGRAELDGLPEGDYEVFVHQTRVGKLQVRTPTAS